MLFLCSQVLSSGEVAGAGKPLDSAMTSHWQHTALQEARLYGILDLGYVSEEDALAVAKKMLVGGVQLLQLRAKGRSPQDIALAGTRPGAALSRASSSLYPE